MKEVSAVTEGLSIFAEGRRVLRIAEQASHGKIDVRSIAHVSSRGKNFPILSFGLGSSDPSVPVFLLVGGVHGLERIGTDVVLSFLESISAQRQWDRNLNDLFDGVRLEAIPILNFVGMWNRTRSNGNGVDLMRNAPIDAEERVPLLAGGHRVGPWLPFYRGISGEPMQTEAQALVDLVRVYQRSSRFVVALDCHSGFGLRDRLWYPFARSSKAFPDLAKVESLIRLWNGVQPQHIYRVERQLYRTHGDLWDYLYESFQSHEDASKRSRNVFIPLTLEMGSWSWIRKNPVQLFSIDGVFNPTKEHRTRRALRRHLPLLGFLLRAAANYESWSLGGD